MKIEILGASGAGKTFLGDELSKKLNFAHIDTDDILWVWDDNIQPYTKSISDKEANCKLYKFMMDNNDLIASGLFYPWAENLIDYFDLLIYIKTPLEIRKKRIIDREIKMYGTRSLEKGDMEGQFKKFLKWACEYDYHSDPNGSKIESEKWIKKHKCPVLYLNGENNINENINTIINFINSIEEEVNLSYDKTKKVRKR